MSKGDIREYACDTCAESIVTTDRDGGRPLYMFSCRATKRCRGYMRPCRLFKGLADKATHEWRKPTDLEISKMTLHSKIFANRGGMLLYEIEDGD